MYTILYLGLRAGSLALLQNHFRASEVTFEETSEMHFSQACQALAAYQALLMGEQVDNPIRFAQQAYSHDKSISILLLTDAANQEKIKRVLQFSPFIGPTVQCISGGMGSGMLPIVEDALQRTSQRRSFARLKSSVIAEQRFTPNVLEQVRADFTTKVLQEAPVGVMLIAAKGTVFSINNYALSLFGKSENQVLGTSICSLFPEAGQQEIKQFLLDGFLAEPKKVFANQGPQGLQYLELTLAPIDLNAAAGFKLLLLNNITSAVLAQQQTQAHLQELEALNAHLARANADLDTFVYTASHDLKAPILNIEGLVYLLEEELGPAHPAAMEIEHIKKAVNSFKQTVEELTEVSRIQKDLEQEVTLIDIAGLLEEVKQLLEQEIAETGAVVVLQAPAGAQVSFSKKHLTSILYNLISNAIKYRSPDRKPHVQVRWWQQDAAYGLAVQDNGLGLPADKLEKIFELFHRMHSHVPGSGVGLYLVKRIVENSGGRIQVESREGQGSVFQLRLKRVNDPPK
jgi:signal transduction histidine kinase